MGLVPLIATVVGLGASAAMSKMGSKQQAAAPAAPTAPETTTTDKAAADEEERKRVVAAERNKTNQTSGLGLGGDADIYQTTLG